MTNKPNINEQQLLELAGLIYKHCGLNYTNNLFTLEPKVMRRLSELQLSCTDYIPYLKKNPGEWELLTQHITINETYFFREEAQFDELARILETYPVKGEIKIWSAACSTGEEPYSIGMTAQSIMPRLKQSVRIIGSDINQRVLKVAAEGYYPKSSLCFRRTSPEQIERFFDAEHNGYRVKPAVRDMTQFRRANLLDPSQLEPIGPVDIIFCRNVLIYFDDQTIDRIIQNFYDMLQPGGYLFLGHAESIRGMGKGFETIKSNQAFYYRKGVGNHGQVRGTHCG
ncbi:CheR family methyltransferase [Paenibacillus wulumuqiensis]|uniref:CheR family methyltransferase n=1 Tax=Paenibacillus wulumuqiensis TaxID=1567107 RepID=UPI000698B4BB|nr:protein-glutamate O-methyltransferase CheR [Paenibacillus wulumuqiensis]